MITGVRTRFLASNVLEKSDGELRAFLGLEHVESETGGVPDTLPSKAATDSLLAAPGDVLFGKLRPYLAKTVRVQEPISCTGEFLVLRPRPGVSPRFLEYVTRSRPWLEWAVASSYGSKMPRTSWELMSELIIDLPDTPDQLAICSYLDRETAKIDALIAKQNQLIDTLRADRASTITAAVTRGLDVDVETTEVDGVHVPTQWDRAVPLKHVATIQTGLTLGRQVDSQRAVSLPYLRVANVQVGRLNLSEITSVEIDKSEVARYSLQPGDVLMTEGGDIDKLGRGCLWTGEIAPCLHQNHVFAVRCLPRLDSRFLVYLLDATPTRNYFMLTAKKTTNLASTNSTTLGRFAFGLPSITEQREIVEFLDSRCAKIDVLIAKSTQMIETLREYRSAVITDAVTCKIDVRAGA